MSPIKEIRGAEFMESSWLRSRVRDQSKVTTRWPPSISFNHSTNGRYWKIFRPAKVRCQSHWGEDLLSRSFMTVCAVAVKGKSIESGIGQEASVKNFV